LTGRIDAVETVDSVTTGTMTAFTKPETRTYQSLYEEFDSPLMSRLRSEAYGEDLASIPGSRATIFVVM
jgi:hypothetical protein